MVHDSVLAGFEHDVEVAPVHGLVGPPAIDHAPFLAHERDVLPVDAARQPVGMRLDQRGSWAIQSSRIPEARALLVPRDD